MVPAAWCDKEECDDEAGDDKEGGTEGCNACGLWYYAGSHEWQQSYGADSEEY